MAYVLPQVQVFQVFRQLPQNVTRNLNAFVFGPHYSLYKYGTADAAPAFNYDGNQNILDWGEINPLHITDAEVDLPYVKVFMDNIWTKYATITGTVGTTALNEVEFAGGLVDTPTAGRMPELAIDVMRGDAVTVGSIRTHVTDIKAEIVPASVGAVTPAASNMGAGAGSVPNTPEDGVELSGTYTGDVVKGITEEEIIITVRTEDTIDVTFVNAGITRRNVVYAGNPAKKAYLGYGIIAEIDNSGHALGRTVTFNVSATTVATTGGAVTVSGTYGRDIPGVFSIYVERGGHMAVDTQVKYSHGEPTLSSALTAVTDYTSVTDGDAEYLITCTKRGTVGDAGDNPATMPEFKFEDISGRNSPRYNQRIYADVGVTVFGATTVTSTAAEQFVGDVAVIQVKAAKPRVAIYDSRGIDGTSAYAVSPGTVIPAGYSGLDVTIINNPSAVLNQGDIFTVDCAPETFGAVNCLVLADNVGVASASVTLDLHVIRNHVTVPPRSNVPGQYNWTVSDNGVTLYSGLAVSNPRMPGSDLPVTSADVTVEYRALRTDYADTVRSVETIEDAQLQLGNRDPDNPLAAGVITALMNSGGRAVYFMGIPTDNETGWTQVLDRATLNSDVYAFAPLTDSRTITNAVSSHVLGMSTETAKHWRIGFFSLQAPNVHAVYNSDVHPTGDDYLATITEYIDGTLRLLTFVDGSGSADMTVTAVGDVRPGDTVKIDFHTDVWGDIVAEEFKVSRVLSNNQLLLATPYEDMGGALTTPSRVEVYHKYTPAELVDATAAVSQSFYHRRLYNVYPDALYSDGVKFSGVYGAAAVAGLVSSVPPQQPMTNITVEGFDDAPGTYQTLNRTQLNKLAEYGTLILAQDKRHGPIYIRHQVSTKAKEGNLNETELSLVKNADSISYFFSERFRPYIGKYNMSPELMALLDTILKDGIAWLGSLTAVGDLGPQLIASETVIEQLAQHPVLKDHAVARVNLGMPKPFNVLQLQLVI